MAQLELEITLVDSGSTYKPDAGEKSGLVKSMSLSPEELGKDKDVVKMIHGEKDAVSVTMYCYSSAQETIDFYSEGIGVHSMFQYSENLKKHKETLDRGVRIRVITEITKDNLPYIKEGLQYVSEVRHMDTITHSFGVSEKHYLSSKLQFGNPRLTQSIFSNVGWFVREQRYLFETLWKKAIPLKQRIREIEEGYKREFVDTIRDPTEVVNLLPKIISSAYQEIMLFFPSLNILRGFESAGLAESIKDHTKKNSNVRVKLLLNNQQERFSYQVKRNSNNTLIENDNVEFKFAEPDKIDTNTALIIADGEKMMTIEFDDEIGGKDYNYYSSSNYLQTTNLTDAIRFASYTNSESAIMSYISIFERLWIESEMKQL